MFLWYNIFMKLVVALGNPGSQYNFTRHNFGFLSADYFFKLHDLTWAPKPQFGAIYGRTDDILFIKPQNFYNDSGTAVRAFSDYYKIPPEDILVICDDFNIPFGTLRYRMGGSAGGNNGLKSVTDHLGTSDFPRLRLGTGNDALRTRIGDTDFVLGKFTPEERGALPPLLSQVSDKITEILS